MMLNHAVKCKKAAEECEQAARYLREMSEGNRQAADDLERMCEHRQYEGAVFALRVDHLIAELVENPDD